MGSRLRRLRIAKGLTQKELADPKYTHAYVSTIESGRRHPSREALEHFAGKLGVDPGELETGRPADLAVRLDLRLQEARNRLSDGHHEEAEAELVSIAKEAKRYGLVRIRARAEEGQGLIRERRGEPEAAIEHYRRSEEILSEEPSTARTDAVTGKARAFQALGDVRYAIHILESQRDALTREGLDDPDSMAAIHATLLDAYLDAGLHRRAVESADELDRLGPRLTEPRRVALMHLHVAHLHLIQGRPDDALRSLQRVEDANRQLNFTTERGFAHLARGIVLSREERYEEARAELEESRAIFEATADQKDLARALCELGRLERLEGRSARARDLLEAGIAITGDTDAAILAETHRELGIALFELDPAGAEKHLRISIDVYERSDQLVETAVAYRWLGDLLSARGEGDAGCEAYRTGILGLERGI
jgi:transcriptional regulator with XRE-family HTH domain